MASQGKYIVLIIALFWVYLTPACLFAQEVESGVSASDRQRNLNIIYHGTSGRVDNAVSRLKSLPVPDDGYELQISQPQPVDKRLIRDFVLYNYAHVADNIVNGQGMYLETLLYLLEVKAEEREARINKFLKMLIEKERIPDFSNSISAYAKEE